MFAESLKLCRHTAAATWLPFCFALTSSVIEPDLGANQALAPPPSISMLTRAKILPS